MKLKIIMICVRNYGLFRVVTQLRGSYLPILPAITNNRSILKSVHENVTAPTLKREREKEIFLLSGL